jgi:coproporphyrinogen III oxidase-like Fe-S oxidoreductase
MLGFRTSEGVALELFSGRAADEAVLEALVGEGVIELSGGRARPTLEGFLLADRLPLRFE